MIPIKVIMYNVIFILNFFAFYEKFNSICIFRAHFAIFIEFLKNLSMNS
jgi:hypothetical protein